MTSLPPTNTTGTHLDPLDGVAMTGYQIYLRIRHGPGSGTLEAASDAADTLVGRYEQRQEQINALSKKMTAAWHGTAAEAAQADLPRLAKVYEDSLASLRAVREHLSGQAYSYRHTYDSVEELPGETSPYSATVIAGDAEQVVDAYRNKASNNVVVYDQYVSQSHEHSKDLPKSFPTITATGVPPVTVLQSAGHPVPGSVSGQEARVPANAAPDGGVDQRDALPTGEGQPGAPSGEGRPGATPTRPDDSVTAQQGWGPDPSLARQWIAEGTGNPQQFSSSAMKEPGGAGFAGLGGIARVPDSSNRDRQVGRNPGAGPRVGVGNDAPRRSVPRSPTSAGAVSGLGGGMWGPLAQRGAGEDDAEHTSGYVVPNDLFAIDAPAWPPVIGVETDDADSEDTDSEDDE
jgi:hypothetical protein